ncbi:uncharacterized protein LOC133333362 [Musca vetustissima]|uniref:uncharacterized protein LOC133333362 n=1 Tax=Musca vetustissima TaxID=27455 RepID=UPI002AB662E0|nr:uncharacterized protein LOC133333362 [Musca vetustissima]
MTPGYYKKLADSPDIFTINESHYVKQLEATAVLAERLQSQVNYGLFKGSIERQQLASTLKFSLTVVCDFGKNLCMYSCQQDPYRRQMELKRVINGEDLDPCEQSKQYSLKDVVKSTDQHRQHLNHTLISKRTLTNAPCVPSSIHLCSILFLGLALVFSLMAVICSCINLKFHPVERIFNIFGLYIWNAIAAGCCFWSLALWGAMFGSHLRYNIAITDTLRQQLNFSSEGYASLGGAYYSLVVVMVLHIINLALLFARRYFVDVQPHSVTNNLNYDDAEPRLEFY